MPLSASHLRRRVFKAAHAASLPKKNALTRPVLMRPRNILAQLACLVTGQYQGLSTFQLLRAANRDFEIARSKVPDLGHVACKARFQCDAVRLGLEVDKQLLSLRVH